MLELRLRTLAPVLDHFAVVACTKTHQGESADRGFIADGFTGALLATRNVKSASLHWVNPDTSLHDRHNGRTYERPTDERGPVGTIWFAKLERQHRDGCRDAALAWTTDPDTTVMVSDVDEIPSVEVVAELGGDLGAAMFATERWWTMEQRMHSGSLNFLHPYQPWLGTCVSRLADLHPQEMRDARTTVDLDDAQCGVIGGSRGWHLSWFGTDAERERKIKTFSHAELRDADPADWRARGVHANGEQLVRLSDAEMAELSWPSPMTDGTFVVPEEWRA